MKLSVCTANVLSTETPSSIYCLYLHVSVSLCSLLHVFGLNFSFLWAQCLRGITCATFLALTHEKKPTLCFTGKVVQSLKLCPLIHIQEVATFLAPAPTFLRNVALHKLFNPVDAELSVIVVVVVTFESLLVIWVGQTWIKPLFDPCGKAQNGVALNVATKQRNVF